MKRMYLATAQSVGTAFTIGSWSIQWYGIIIASALLLGIGITMATFKRKGMDPDAVLDLALIVVPLAIIGARAHYVIWSWNEFAGRPFWHVFAVWEGGMAIFGAIILGMVGLFIYGKWKKVPFYTLCDCLVPALALGQAIGRWGNFFNQEVYGAAVTNPALQWFPMSVFIDVTGQYHYALFFYESVIDLAIFALLFFWITRKAKRPGTAFWTYLLLYGTARAILEGFREEVYIQRTAGLPMNQIFAAALAVLAATVLIVRLVKSRREKWTGELADELVLIPDRAKVKVDAEGNVIGRDGETGEEQQAQAPEQEVARPQTADSDHDANQGAAPGEGEQP
jgi:phosphatidylglycerol:prolipoprotein diacylglycerol transferase